MWGALVDDVLTYGLFLVSIPFALLFALLAWCKAKQMMRDADGINKDH